MRRRPRRRRRNSRAISVYVGETERDTCRRSLLCNGAAALPRERQDAQARSALRILPGRGPRSHRGRTPAEQVSAPSLTPQPLNRSQARAGVGRESGPAPSRGYASPHRMAGNRAAGRRVARHRRVDTRCVFGLHRRPPKDREYLRRSRTAHARFLFRRPAQRCSIWVCQPAAIPSRTSPGPASDPETVWHQQMGFVSLARNSLQSAHQECIGLRRPRVSGRMLSFCHCLPYSAG